MPEKPRRKKRVAQSSIDSLTLSELPGAMLTRGAATEPVPRRHPLKHVNSTAAACSPGTKDRLSLCQDPREHGTRLAAQAKADQQREFADRPCLRCGLAI